MNVTRQLKLREWIDICFPDSLLDSGTNRPEVRSIADNYPELPEEYLCFLLTVGSGSVGHQRLQVYGSPMTPEEVFDLPAPKVPIEALLIGDNCNGMYIGYYGGKLFTYCRRTELVSFHGEITLTQFVEELLSSTDVRRQ